jgi:hypothetical protein
MNAHPAGPESSNPTTESCMGDSDPQLRSSVQHGKRQSIRHAINRRRPVLGINISSEARTPSSWVSRRCRTHSSRTSQSHAFHGRPEPVLTVPPIGTVPQSGQDSNASCAPASSRWDTTSSPAPPSSASTASTSTLVSSRLSSTTGVPRSRTLRTAAEDSRAETKIIPSTVALSRTSTASGSSETSGSRIRTIRYPRSRSRFCNDSTMTG